MVKVSRSRGVSIGGKGVVGLDGPVWTDRSWVVVSNSFSRRWISDSETRSSSSRAAEMTRLTLLQNLCAARRVSKYSPIPGCPLPLRTPLNSPNAGGYPFLEAVLGQRAQPSLSGDSNGGLAVLNTYLPLGNDATSSPRIQGFFIADPRL
jgi:hypothetical protein